MADPRFENVVSLVPMNSAVLMDIAGQCLSDSDRWFPHQQKDVAFLALCMSGEAGEINNKVKKVLRGDKTFEEAHEEIVGEVVDVFIYLMNLVGTLDFDLYAEYMKKRAICEGRWGPEGRVIPRQFDYETEGFGGT